MTPDLMLGWRTALLGMAGGLCLVLAVALWLDDGNRAANRLLAAALVVIAGLLTPFTIGFAGLYDAYRWLTFLPVAVPLALGPFLYAYARALTDGRLPRKFARHMVPAGVQWLYLALAFLLPMPAKWLWYVGGHATWIDPIFEILSPVSLAAYAWATASVLAENRARLAQGRSDDDRFAAAWLRRVLAAITIGVVAQTGFWAWSVVTGGIDYFQQTGLYLAYSALGLYLGIAGWRHAALPVPLPILPSHSTRSGRESGGPLGAEPDWSFVAADIETRTRAAQWWREPDLSLASLARHLGTNSGRVSRAINAGLDVNFSTFVNGLRAEGVADALRRNPEAELLPVALEMGFSSKASFNRAFLARHGVSPSRFRDQVSDPAFVSTQANLRRAPS